MFDHRELKIGSIDYAAGASKVLTNGIPRDKALRALSLRLAGRLVISGGTTSGTPWVENPMTLIDRVRVFGTKKGGAVEIVNLSAASLFEITHIISKTNPEKTAVTSGAAATTDFIANFEVPLRAIRVESQDEALTLLPSWVFDTLDLELRFRNGTAVTDGGLISGGDRTLALTAYGSGSGSPSVSVVAQQVENANKDLQRSALCKLYNKTMVTEAVEASRKETMNRGAFYRALIFKTYSETAERALSNAIVTNIKLNIGGNSKYDWPWADLQAAMKRNLALESVQTGYALLDFCPGQDLDTALDTTAYNVAGTSLEVELALTGAANNRTEIIVAEGLAAGRW